MAGLTTAQRDDTLSSSSGPPSSPEPERGRRWRLPGLRTLIVVLVALVLLAAGGVWLLYGSTWLRTEKVAVSGVRVLTHREVTTAARVPLESPLVSVDTDAIAARLRAELPRIDSVDVVRNWPDGIGLKVTERVPVVFAEKGGKFIEVDAGGVRFATVDKAPEGVPRLEWETGGSPSLRRFGAARLQREGVRVATQLPEAVRRDTRALKIGSYDSIVLELTGGRTVVWGSSEHGAAKAKTLLSLMKTARSADHFDVSAPTAPSVSGS
ncbi:FtsQ-type POTRA domain-containing protein [Streptomyces pathocidini]|uniref:cell division protein FtsQ/DivIB n=1 Tax=Streptomyces pathocidini TaxID=1650571 RepID=UPI0033C81FAF